MSHVSEMVGTMSTKIVTVQEAEGHLLELIGLVEKGEEVVITHDDQPKVKLVPIVEPPKNGCSANIEARSGRAPTLTTPYRMTFGSAAAHEIAARYTYLPVVG